MALWMVAMAGCDLTVHAGGKCNAQTCQGCCAADGQCELGVQLQACGTGAALCRNCAETNQTCSLGACVASGSGGGSSTGGGSSSGGGSATGGGSSSGGGSASGGGTGGGGTSTGGGSGTGGGTGSSGLDAGQFDSAFGTTAISFGNMLEGFTVAATANDTLTIAGSYSSYPSYPAFARVLYDGGLDPGFGTGGKVTLTAVTNLDNIQHTVIASGPDGALIAAGEAQFNTTGSCGITNDLFLARLTPAGVPDPAFGTSGVQYLALTDPAGSCTDPYLGGIAVGTGGDVYVVTGSNSYPSAFELHHYTSTGANDSSFGTGGVASVGFTYGLVAQAFDRQPVVGVVAIQSDGKPVAIANDNLVQTGVDTPSEATALRFTTTGGLDSSYGTSGKVSQALGPNNSAAISIAIDAQDRLVIAGYRQSTSGATVDDSKYDLVVRRLDTTGHRDASFANGAGEYVLDLAGDTDMPAKVAIDSQGRIAVIASSSSGRAPAPGPFWRRLVAVRLLADGAPDSSFGNNGVAVWDNGPSDTQYAWDGALWGDTVAVLHDYGYHDGFGVSRFGW